MLRYPLTAALTALAALASTGALAHHSAAAFDTEVETAVTGTVTAYSFRNPHVYLTLDVRQPDGSLQRVEIEAGAGSVLNPLGFTRDAVAVGDSVTVRGNPGKRDPAGLLLGRELYKADGTYYPLNISSRSVYTEAEGSATSLAGTWFSPRTSFFGFLGAANGWPLNEAARAAMAAAASLPTPQKDCQPIGAPALLFYPVANQIEVFADRVEMHIDWLDAERTIWLDGRAHPPATETFAQGHSIGHFEGTSLLVDSSNFAANPIGLTTALPSSTAKHLSERFELSADGKQLTYSGTLEDSEYLNGAVTWSGSWQYRPGMQRSNEACDLETARKFLDD